MLDSLLKRKSTRVYLDKAIEVEKKELIFEAALRAPTAGNMSLYSIIEVEDQAIKDKLAKSCDNQPFIARAPLVLVFVADYSRWHKLFRDKDPSSRPPQQGDLFLAACDALIAAQSAAVASEALGLGSCYVGDILEEAEFHRELFDLPDYTMVVTMLCIGYPTEQQLNRKQPPRFSEKAMIYRDRYEKRSLSQLKEDLEERDPVRGAQAQIDDLYHRKWTSAFLEEMNRSVKKWLSWWE